MHYIWSHLGRDCRLQEQEKKQEQEQELPLCDLIKTETFAVLDIFIGPVGEHEEYVNRSVLVGYVERLKIQIEVKFWYSIERQSQIDGNDTIWIIKTEKKTFYISV